jgi:hypothetical protein
MNDRNVIAGMLIAEPASRPQLEIGHMPPTAVPNVTKAARTARLSKPVQDEWGVYDPEQAGLPATLRALMSTPEEHARLTPSAEAAAAAVAPAVTVAPVMPAAPVAPVMHDAPEPGAIYSVESPLRCPHCQMAIRTFRALRVLRTHVNFMSTLPRKGYVLVCPECAGLLSAELSGLL